jgi:hypothetical protein
MIWVNIMVNPFKNSRKWLNPKIYNTNDWGGVFGDLSFVNHKIFFLNPNIKRKNLIISPFEIPKCGVLSQ